MCILFYTVNFQGAKISNLFLDPSGHHLLISLKSSEAEAGPSLYYLHSKWQQPKSENHENVETYFFPLHFSRLCNKFKGTLVSAVGWAQGQVAITTIYHNNNNQHEAHSYNPFIFLIFCEIICKGWCKHGATVGRNNPGLDH